MKRIAVIGGGPGGLASAVMLQAAGFAVTLFEARSTLGGRNGKFTLKGDGRDTFHFDIGPTFLLMPQVVEHVFRRAGRRMDDYLDLKRIDPMYRLHFSDNSTFEPRDTFGEMQKALAALNPKDGEAYAKYYAYMDRKLEAVLPVLSVPYSNLRSLISKELLGAARYLRPERSLHGELASFFSDERTQLSFGFQAKYIGMSPFECPSLFTILNFIEQRYGVWHPVGGVNRVSDAFAEVFVELGGKIELDAPVEEVLSSKGKISAIVVNGEALAFDHFVANADFAKFMSDAVPEEARPKYTDRKLQQLKYSCSTFMLYLGVDKQVALPHHSIVFSRDYKEYLRDVTERGLFPNDPSFYVCNPVATDPTMAPAGKSALYILAPVPNLQIGKIGWQEEASRFRSLLLSQISARLGVDLEGKISAEKMLTPLDWESELRVQNGAVFSITHSLDQLLFFRPHNKFEEFENMYLVGGGTHPGSGLPTILQSAQICTDLILAKERPDLVKADPRAWYKLPKLSPTLSRA